MKKIIKIALVASLLTNIASANPIGRMGLDKIVREFSIPYIKALNEEAHGFTSNFFAKNKKYAESLLLEVWHEHIKKGVIPSRQELIELDNCFAKANHGILNLPGEGGHTLLKNVLDWPESLGRTKFLKELCDRGAQLNARDKYVMGAEKLLKTYLNVPMEASAWRTIKALRTFMTKNTKEKVDIRVAFSKITKSQGQERLKKVKEIQELYPEVEKDLLVQRAQEQKARSRNKII
jgi:hypothetical protein